MTPRQRANAVHPGGQDRVERRLAAILAADVVGYSRLMGLDEEGTLSRLKSLRRDLIDPKIAEHHGRIVKTTGDGILIEFPSVVEAVQCAVEVQQAMAGRNAEVPAERRIEFRVGINLGDIMVDGGDIFGDGVNVAARLQALADPGGVCISRVVRDQVRDKLSLGFQDMGEQTVKNIARPIHVYRLRSKDVDDQVKAQVQRRAEEQEIHFCTAADGVRIAYATVGDGPALVKAANWMGHLEFEWQSPVWRHLIHEFARDHRFVRYDERGTGLSDWHAPDVSFEMFVRDLEAVVDALGLKRFPLMGISQGGAVSVAYAARHPERVSRLILYGAYARGWRKRGSADEIARREALLTLVRQGWGKDNPAFRQVFTSLFMPDGSPEEMQWFNDLQRFTSSAENAERLQRSMGEIDVVDLLPRIAAPTLVLHCRGDEVVPFEQGRELARGIRGSRFVAFESRNHLIVEHEPAWPRFVAEAQSFLRDDG